MTYLHAPLRTEPVGSFGSKTTALAADHVADQKVPVGVSVKETGIVVIAADGAQPGKVCINAFSPQFQTFHTRHFRQYESRVHGGTPRIADRRDLILSKRIVVERQPISQVRNTITKIKTCTAVAGIRRFTGIRVGESECAQV